MKLSHYFSPTLKEAPSEAEIASHKLLIRAGMIKKIAAGIYSFLPMGKRILSKVENIIRQEMDATGAQEVLMPVLQPAELWQKTGRWAEYGPEMMRIKDRNERDFALGPTHEELITSIVGSEVRSYKDLPQTLYQIQVKFRDEIRPRFGLMRAREFIMKDAYSFHDSQENLQETYDKMSEAYANIVNRCGLKYRSVKAEAGLMGGDFSEEFMVIAETGEETILFCENCHFGAGTCEGNVCPNCGGNIQTSKGIEIGHIFQLGTKYSKAIGATYLDKEGKSQPIIMGCYGIGVTRLIAAAIEQNHDEEGIIWPKNLAPFQAIIIQTDMREEKLIKAAAKLLEELSGKGIEVIYDDREERAGIKFADADLIGYPLQLVLGKTFLENEQVELKVRATGETTNIASGKISAEIDNLLK